FLDIESAPTLDYGTDAHCGQLDKTGKIGISQLGLKNTANFGMAAAKEEMTCMQTRKVVALSILVLCSTALRGVELVPVPGSANRYPTAIDGVHAGKPIKLLLTGASLRKKVVFSVYTIGSYVQDGATVRSADEIVAADCLKQL